MKKKLSAVKKMQLSIRNRTRNRSYKSAIKTSVKKYLLYLNSSDQFSLSIGLQYLSLVYKRIDKAVKSGVLHRNTAARKKSRLAKILKLNS